MDILYIIVDRIFLKPGFKDNRNVEKIFLCDFSESLSPKIGNWLSTTHNLYLQPCTERSLTLCYTVGLVYFEDFP